MKVLFLNLPYFDLRYQIHKEMGGGVGFKNLKPSVNSENKIYPIVDLINAATIVNKKYDASIIDSFLSLKIAMIIIISSKILVKKLITFL